MRYLQSIKFFGQTLFINPSHLVSISNIQDSNQDLGKDFTEIEFSNSYYRFKLNEVNQLKSLTKPSNTLHFSNFNSTLSIEDLNSLFSNASETSNLQIPIKIIKHKIFTVKNKSNSMKEEKSNMLIEFENIEQAVAVLSKYHNTIIEDK